MIKVITYGTYDLLHQGHINLLKRAKELGDYLIGGVTNDSFDQERGKLNVKDNVLERVEAVRATGLADQIIIEDYVGQKINDIQKYNVDIFAVGSDWEGQFDYLNKFCEVVYLPRTQGISSTFLREKLDTMNAAVVKRVLVVGGANGIGLSIATEFASRADCEKVYIVDKAELLQDFSNPKFLSHQFDLNSEDYSFFDQFSDIDALIITAGFGQLTLFKDVSEEYIISSMTVNATAVMRLIHRFYDKIHSNKDFYCAVMVSIAGFMSSPFFAVYGASKAALKIFIESVNIELEKAGFSNRILNVSPGSMEGTSFNDAKTDLSLTQEMAQEIIFHTLAKDDLFIPQYNEIFKNVLERYHEDFRKEGRHSYDYKLKSGRIKSIK